MTQIAKEKLAKKNEIELCREIEYINERIRETVERGENQAGVEIKDKFRSEIQQAFAKFTFSKGHAVLCDCDTNGCIDLISW